MKYREIRKNRINEEFDEIERNNKLKELYGFNENNISRRKNFEAEKVRETGKIGEMSSHMSNHNSYDSSIYSYDSSIYSYDSSIYKDAAVEIEKDRTYRWPSFRTMYSIIEAIDDEPDLTVINYELFNFLNYIVESINKYRFNETFDKDASDVAKTKTSISLWIEYYIDCMVNLYKINRYSKDNHTYILNKIKKAEREIMEVANKYDLPFESVLKDNEIDKSNESNKKL